MSDPAENRDVRGNTIKPHSVEAESVNTDFTESDAVVSGSTVESAPLSARKNTVEAQDLFETYSEIGNPYQDGRQTRFPTITHAASVFDNPLGDYYIYTSPYQTDTIDLYYTDDPASLPWSYFGTVLTAEPESGQADSPNVVYVPEAGEIWMYYHEGGAQVTGESSQNTLLATVPDSGDGTAFTKANNANALPGLDGKRNGRWDGNERTYFSVARQGTQFVGVYMGRDQFLNERGIGMAWSADGVNWDTLDRPIAWGNLRPDWDPTTELNIGGPSLLKVGGEVFITYNTEENTRAISWDAAFHATGPEDTFVFPEGFKLLSGDAVTVGSKTYAVTKQEIGTLDWEEYL